MSRLIDAEKLIEIFNHDLKCFETDGKAEEKMYISVADMRKMINEQPTAYDENAIIAYGTECYKKGREEWIEKIVGKLDNAESIKIFGSLNSGNRLIPVNDAINIVKAGGIDG